MSTVIKGATALYDNGKYRITLDENNTFKLEGPDDLTTRFDSFVRAKEAAERYIANAAKAKKRKVSLPAVTSNGKSVTITGLHARTGATLYTPPNTSKRYGRRPELYADAPGVWGIIEQIKHLDAQRAELANRLDRARLPDFERYGFGEKDYDQCLSAFEQAYTAAIHDFARGEKERAA